MQPKKSLKQRVTVYFNPAQDPAYLPRLLAYLNSEEFELVECQQTKKEWKAYEIEQQELQGSAKESGGRKNQERVRLPAVRLGDAPLESLQDSSEAIVTLAGDLYLHEDNFIKEHEIQCKKIFKNLDLYFRINSRKEEDVASNDNSSNTNTCNDNSSSDDSESDETSGDGNKKLEKFQPYAEKEINELHDMLQSVEDNLERQDREEHSQFMYKNSLSLLDIEWFLFCHKHEYLLLHKSFRSEFFARFKRLYGFHEEIRALPRVQRWIEEVYKEAMEEENIGSKEIRSLVFNSSVRVAIVYKRLMEKKNDPQIVNEQKISDDTEIASQGTTIFFKNIKNLHYASIYAPEICEYFEEELLSDGAKYVWLECAGAAVPWDLPFGVVADLWQLSYKLCEDPFVLYLRAAVDTEELGGTYSTQSYLQSIQKCLAASKDIRVNPGIESYWNSLKEAVEIRYKAQAPIVQDLRDGNDFLEKEAYLELNEKQFFRTCTLNPGTQKEVQCNVWDQLLWKVERDRPIGDVPLRVCLPGDFIRTQRRAELVHGRETVGGFLFSLLVRSDDPPPLPLEARQQEKKYENELRQKYPTLTVRTHGVEISLKTRLVFLQRRFNYPDGFVYLIVTFL